MERLGLLKGAEPANGDTHQPRLCGQSGVVINGKEWGLSVFAAAPPDRE